MLKIVHRLALRLAKEPPFRLFAKAAVKTLPFSIRTKSFWDGAKRNNYLMGMLSAAEQARSQHLSEFSVVEFGVARGEGLLDMQKFAERVEGETGIRILVYGFDSGVGLPRVTGDYRDHPDEWKIGDFPMDVAWLRSRLTSRTELVLGDVADTVVGFAPSAPIGFVSFDLDLYSSTKDALCVLSSVHRRILNRVFLYFDDIHLVQCHHRAGEWLAINEFNEENENLYIDSWQGIARGRPFPEADWLQRMFILHDLDAISRYSLSRPSLQKIGQRL